MLRSRSEIGVGDEEALDHGGQVVDRVGLTDDDGVLADRDEPLRAVGADVRPSRLAGDLTLLQVGAASGDPVDELLGLGRVELAVEAQEDEERGIGAVGNGRGSGLGVVATERECARTIFNDLIVVDEESQPIAGIPQIGDIGRGQSCVEEEYVV